MTREKPPLRPTALERRAIFALVAWLFVGCTSSTKYQAASADVPPAKLINVRFPQKFPEATLNTVIIYGGPGSWKREAWWDEYVVTLHNSGARDLTIVAADVVDFAGVDRPAGFDPWIVEKTSKALCEDYRRAGVTFVREVGSAALYVGGIAAGMSAFASLASTGGVTVTVMQGPVALFTVPSYVVGRVVANHEDRADIEADFHMRAFKLPMTLAPGQRRCGSFFFPMIPNPRALRLRWEMDEKAGSAELGLDCLRGLHTSPTKNPSVGSARWNSGRAFAQKIPDARFR
jgi:hypothetical protein